MSRRHRAVDGLAAEVGPEDGSDPKAFHDRRMAAHERGRGPGRKGLQLCGQVRDALAGALAACGDDVLRNLTVVSVEPAPNTGRLMVTVAGPDPADATDRRLSAAAGLLRRDVAAAICRRKTPELAFRVV